MAFDLSFNAIVSVLATGCKSALILVVGEAICQLKWLHFSERRKLSDIQEFEEASRGPLGSFTILVRHRANSLVSIGAAVVVLMLAFEPFMQQLISFPIRPVKLPNGQATAKQLHNFGTDKNFQMSEPPGDPFEDINTWEDSFTKGVWLDGSFESEPVCSLGDCTWETFSSLGVCSRCWDMTSSAQLKCDVPESTWHSNGSCQIVMPNTDMVGHAFQVEVDYLIGVPSGMKYLSIEFPTSILWTVFESSDDSSDSENQFTVTIFNNSDIQSSPDIQLPKFYGMAQPLVAYAFAQIDIARGVSTASVSDLISMKNATMCSLGTCLHDYEVSMYNGQASIQTRNIDFGTNFIHTAFQNETNNYESYTGACWAPQNKSKTAFTSCLGMDMVPLSGHTFFPAESNATFENSTTQWTNESNVDYDESPILNRIDRIGFEKMILNLAASFTKTGLEITNDTFNGTVHGSKVFVSVQWYWLILPALLMITGTIFFTITVVVNRRARIPLWKSSALASFYHGVERDQLGDGNFVSTSGMKEAAEGVEVQLKDAEDDARLMLRG